MQEILIKKNLKNLVVLFRIHNLMVNLTAYQNQHGNHFLHRNF